MVRRRSVDHLQILNFISSHGLNRGFTVYIATEDITSHADILLARHAIFPPQRTFVGEERLRDEPKECLRGRLQKIIRYVYKIQMPV